ncbi:MAG TPA: efflux RND transporter permease subunit [Candidatus Krumholzibacteria bacterium]|nr:efflux RND transporter permease subunit [Candidatus Krumholzibacteria bacterium]
MLKGAIQRPIAVSMLFLALMLLGLISYKRLPVDLLPSIVYPRLTVITTYTDIPAEDLERLVTRPLEEVITALAGVRGVTSRTREGISAITVEYEWGTEMDFANLHLREAVDRVAFRDDFPEGADRPSILRWDPTARPISNLVLRADGRRLQNLTDFAEEVVKPALEQVDGVSQAEVIGGATREILVQPDPRKLAVYGITIEDIRNALARSNVSFPGGRIRQGPLQLSLRIAGEYENLDEIAATDITQSGSATIRIGDVAKVLDTTKEPEGAALSGNEQVVALLIYKEPAANTIQVSKEVDESLANLRGEYGDFKSEFIYRDADYVKESFRGLRNSLLAGAILAFLVLFFFLRDFRSPVVVGISIPVSIIITFGFLYFSKVNLNLMSLGGLSLAAGMLVDNAIVVLENINRHLRERRGEGGAEAKPQSIPAARYDAQRRMVANCSASGTTEMTRPVIASTLTTIAVFFPVVYVPGIAGAFFRDQALTVTLSLLVSVLAALLLQPVLASRVLRVATQPKGMFRAFENSFNAFHDIYHRALEGALRHRAWMIVALLLFLGGSLLYGANLPRTFMPKRSSGDMRLDLELPAGTPLRETVSMTGDLASWIEKDEAVKIVFSQVGSTEHTLSSLQDYTAPNTARLRILLKPSRDSQREGQRLENEISAHLNSYDGVNFVFREEGIGLEEVLSAGGGGFQMGVVSEDASLAVDTANELAKELKAVKGLKDIQVDRVLGNPNIVVRLDREAILRSGLDPQMIATELKNRIAGTEATTFNEVEQRIDIAVRFDENTRKDLDQVLRDAINVGNGKSVALASFLSIKEERPVRELVRKNQNRMVTVSADVEGRSLDDVWDEANAIGQKLVEGKTVRLIQSGERSDRNKSFRDLGWAMLLAVVLVYMILAAQFESFLDPLLIAAILPIGLAGAFLAIGISGNSLNMLSIIGVVALIGIAVNDAIVKVDTIQRLREEGMDGYEAIMRASSLRLRPIIMTSVTTVLGMLPMAIGLGSGEQLQRPLAVTIIGGLTLTTALTLFYTPILYQMAHHIRAQKR